MRTNNPIESPEDFFRFNFGYDVVKDSEQIMKIAFPDWNLPETFVGKKAAELAAKRVDAKVEIRSIVASIESTRA